MSDIISMENKRRVYIWGGIGALVCAGGLFLFGVFSNPDRPDTATAINPPPTERVKGGAGGSGTPEYNNKVKQYDQQQADAALQAGDSYIATPTGKRSSLLTRRDEAKPLQQQPLPVARPMPIRQQPRPNNNDRLKRMLEDLQALEERLNSVSVAQASLFYQRDFSKEVQKEIPAATDSAKSDETVSHRSLRTGDILYAVVDTGVNSDVPSAVMATVTAGKYNKTKLIGRFQRHDERLVLAFTNAVLPDGSRVQVEAYAIDPETTEASVASSVDTHFLSRWGGLIASSFLEGLGQVKRLSGATSTLYGGYSNSGSDYLLWNDYSLEDQAWIAAGKVGEKSGKIFEKNFDRPPTVYLEAGSPIGVLIMNVKDSKGK
ncbi:MAG: DotG/IcmE/VirB10 family protein [Desulfovibrio sp.]|nr:DotG/IcmE/VirB10 family protein [Desulfovibrio sp.]